QTNFERSCSTGSKYHYLNIEFFTVFTDNDLDIWRAYLAKRIPKSWVNTYEFDQPDRPTIAYHIKQTPSLFLLDADKIILNKHITVAELDRYLFQVAQKSKF
ncbi:unnamed protein product, partial [marine sediment metagenome]